MPGMIKARNRTQNISGFEERNGKNPQGGVLFSVRGNLPYSWKYRLPMTHTAIFNLKLPKCDYTYDYLL